MGISGLLPLLKPIQVQRHLSEYAGQTIAVDAYVWLHRGTYACAADLATGKNTTKYVDYAMHRVRLLRHHNITPYIVFDGGPLPAKKGTESERKQRRDENLDRANSLAAQGKHTQAREFYVKCIDVTPQMAYQLIKALRAESVPYVVAPYEADAQLAYLERIGLVDGILTEDSDLLVFGCKTVLLKLDAVEAMVTSISRVDFASLGATTVGGFSLLGWSDVQFRAMAILSGCDYLPSISGVGLKTAWALLKKHRTIENAVRALRLEGKKDVPKGYLEAFRLAENVFLHQRVYDPTQEQLVYLTDVPDGEDWDEAKEAHVGRYIEPSLAKRIAEGDACPITLLPMEDINPTFVPRALKPIPMNILLSSKSDAKGKGKAKALFSEKANSTGILNFFPAKSRAAVTAKSASQPVPRLGTGSSEKSRIVAGRASGKRTLAEVLDHDLAAKRKKREETERPATPARYTPTDTPSRFFGVASSSTMKLPAGIELERTAGPSRPRLSEGNKENITSIDEDEVDEFSCEEEADPVMQEDGYISPSPSLSRFDTPELSSPLRPGTSSSKLSVDDMEDDGFGADILSSPPSIRSKPPAFRKGRNTRAPTPVDQQHAGRVLVCSTPTKSGKVKTDMVPGPDLQDIFSDWNDVGDHFDNSADISVASEASSHGPNTPEDSRILREIQVAEALDEILSDDEDNSELRARQQRIVDGWRKQYASRPRKFPAYGAPRRRETTITPEGRQRLKNSLAPKTASTAKHSPRQKPPITRTTAFVNLEGNPGNVQSTRHAIRVEGILPSARSKLEGFRYAAA
ncbi:unnamed protein product [Somion occarium]|uniref:Exonuclease 1 n=2 Tax=Somion occarium TaxID=3059160 RepID=A0ABP1CVJ7_9APHY